MRWLFLIELMIAATATGALFYPGELLDFLLFGLVFFAILWSGVSLPFQYSHFFISIAWFIGLWLKLVVHFVFGHFGWSEAARYVEPVGSFDGSAGAWNQVLLTASVGGLGYLLGRLVLLPAFRKRSYLPAKLDAPQWYGRLRTLLWVSFAVLLIAIVFVNGETGLIVRGWVPRVQLPWPLGGLFAWTTDIGLALAISVLAAWDRALGAGLLRGFFCAVHRRSRPVGRDEQSRDLFVSHAAGGSVGGAYAVSGAVATSAKQRVVDHLACGRRNHSGARDRGSGADGTLRDSAVAARVEPDTAQPVKPAALVDPLSVLKYAFKGASRLVIDRWTGLEGLMSVVSYPQRGLPLFKEAALQRRSMSIREDQRLGFYRGTGPEIP